MPCGIRFRVGRNKWFPGIFRTYRASRLEVDDRAHPDPSVVPRRGAALLVVGGVVVHAAAAEAPTATPIPDSAGRGFTSYLDPLCGYLPSAGFLSPGGTTKGNTSAPAC